ncbi:MAG: hypothetical protein LC118_15030 [Dehalococcoidia bacterium]|nr:hypothetical protein [Dehalococcoidia bacterium]
MTYRPDPARAQQMLAAAQRARVGLASASIEAFARIYLMQHFRTEPSSMHKELFAQLEEMTFRGRGEGVGRTWPSRRRAATPRARW